MGLRGLTLVQSRQSGVKIAKKDKRVKLSKNVKRVKCSKKAKKGETDVP